MPSASAAGAIVDAVPMVLQCPRLRIIADSERVNCSAVGVPARTSSDNRQTSLPQPREPFAEAAGQHRPTGSTRTAGAYVLTAGECATDPPVPAPDPRDAGLGPARPRGRVTSRHKVRPA
jgi:hypothetical protein